MRCTADPAPWLRVLALSLVLLGAQSASSVTINLSPVAQGTVIDNDADGFDQITTPDLQAGFQDTASGNRSIRRAIAEFDLSQRPTSYSGVTLQIAQTGSGPGIANYEFHGYGGDGVVSLADALNIGTLLTPPFHSANGTLEFDVTAFVDQLLLGGATHAGILIKGTNEAFYFQDFVGVDSYNRSYSPPFLRFDTAPAPEPGIPSLLLGGIVTLQIARRRSWR